MWTRLLAFVFGTFWLVMLGLLCWSEFGGRRHLGSGASVATVWNKMLNSPDFSALVIHYGNEDIGYCKWAPTILQSSAKSTGSEDARNLEGMVRDVVGYNLTLDGAFTLPGDKNRYSFKLKLNFSKADQWRDFDFKFNDSATTVRLTSVATTKELELKVEGATELQTRIDFDDLRNPGQLVGQLGGPLAALAFANLPFLPRGTNGSPALASLAWDAQYDWIRILNQRVQCYRLSTRVLDRHEIVVYISRVGEVLRIELPAGVTMVNDTELQM
jgi:hypothetical protein